MSIADLSEVEFFTIEDDHGRSYIALAKPREDIQEEKKEAARALLEQLGVPVPEELK